MNWGRIMRSIDREPTRDSMNFWHWPQHLANFDAKWRLLAEKDIIKI
jgi:hypothetical protein